MSFAVALLHIIIIILVGTPAYRYFGAGENLAQGGNGFGSSGFAHLHSGRYLCNLGLICFVVDKSRAPSAAA